MLQDSEAGCPSGITGDERGRKGAAYNKPFAFLRSFPAMERATQRELQLARRMSRLGTETAFEVLNKARALERQGKSIIHLTTARQPDCRTCAKPWRNM
jgi:hypothetical protein